MKCGVAGCTRPAVVAMPVHGDPFPLCNGHDNPPVCIKCREPMPYGDLIGDGRHATCTG